MLNRYKGGVAQLVRASACHAEGRGFESRHSRHFNIYQYNISMTKIHIAKVSNGLSFPIPEYATHGSAGVDLRAAIIEDIIIEPNTSCIIPAGIAISLPVGYEAQIRPRSGLAADYQMTVLNTPGTIDSDYRGEIKIILINHGKSAFTVKAGMRIAQMIIAKYEVITFEEVDDLHKNRTVRGDGGFGSTGL